jgi:hypothetical protein
MFSEKSKPLILAALTQYHPSQWKSRNGTAYINVDFRRNSIFRPEYTREHWGDINQGERGL